MSEADIQFKAPGRPLGEFGFENGRRVPVVWPDMDGLSPDESGAAAAALDVVRRGLCCVIEAGHRDGCRVRAGALAYLCGLYRTQAEAAETLGIGRSAMSEAITDMRHRLSLPNDPPIDRGNHAPNETTT